MHEKPNFLRCDAAGEARASYAIIRILLISCNAF
jgi:hypothetical protein